MCLAAFGECVGLSPFVNTTLRPSIVWLGRFFACLCIFILNSHRLFFSLSIFLSISLLVFIYLTRSRRVFCTHTCASSMATPASFSSHRIPRISTPCRRVNNTCTMVCDFVLLYVASEICFISSSESYTFMSILAFTSPLT